MSVDFTTAGVGPSNETPFATPLDLARRFGDIPLSRIRFTPAPGEATDGDVLAINDHEGRLFELVDGTLVEKAMGTYESLIAVRILTAINVYLASNRIGIALGADGMLRLRAKLIRIPDASFIAKERLRKGTFPRRGVAPIAPTIAVEVMSEGNTKREMEEKLDDYFQHAAAEVWYVYPETKTVQRYTSRHDFETLREQHTLTTPVLPGFACPLAPLFLHPDDEFSDGDASFDG